MRRLITVLFVMFMAIILTMNVVLLADQASERLVAGSGYLIPKSSMIYVGEITNVSWDADAKVPGSAGKATFAVKNGIRGSKQGEEIVLAVQEIRPIAIVDGSNFFWQGLKFTKADHWLVFVGGGENAVLDIMQLERVDAPIVKDVEKAAGIDSKKPDEQLKDIQAALSGKSLKPVLLVNYGIEAAGRLVRTHPQACSTLLSVATESTNPAAIRAAALDAIDRNLADGRQEDERLVWAEEFKKLLEAVPKIEDSSIEILRQYSTVLSNAIHLGSWEKMVVVPSDVKLESPDKVKDALRSVAGKLDESLPATKEKLATAKSPATTFPAEYQREQRIFELQSLIADTEKLNKFLETLAASAATPR